MSIPNRAYYNAFNLIPQMGPIRFSRLENYFPSLEEAWGAGILELKQSGIEEKIAEKILEQRKNIDIEQEWEKIEKENIRVIIKEDKLYPERLKEISSAPAVLYLKGEIIPDDFFIAVVGSRKVSEYGRRVTEDFSRDLAAFGATIVSGMAFGVDFIAQRECVKLQKRTVAVLGNGLDEKSIYPASNRAIAKEIANCGCLVSEYPLGTPPLRQNFPARNRIISGISRGVLIVEASESSGSLITAKFALEQNREIFAIPGNIYSKNSEGTNNLIKMGARLVTNAKEILEEFNINISESKTAEIIPENSEEALILQNLQKDEATHIDILSKNTQIKTAPLSSILTLMEIKGSVKNIGGMRYIKK